MSKNRKKNKGPTDLIPQLDLKKKNYMHEVPEGIHLEMHIEWKIKDAERDVVGPLRAFAIEDGMLKVLNRSIDLIYKYPVKELRRVHLVTTKV